ncbi:MAG: hypothetical protein F4Y57_11420 [Acidobacteria bacterium]|nr:hypothetical protein [Acidobacteriota bacterium]
MVTLVSGAIAALMLAWQVVEARIRLGGEADVVVAAVAARGYALHHWLNAQPDPALRPQAPSAGRARRLTLVEETALAGHGATAGWLALPNGWETVELVAEPRGQDGTPLPHGVVVLTIPADAQDRLVDLPRAVRTALATDLGGSAAADLAATALAGFDATRDVALLAWRFGRVDESGLLRSRRAGFSPPRMSQDLDLDGNDVTRGDRIEAATLVAGSVGPLDDGDAATVEPRFLNGMTVEGDVVAAPADFTLGNPLSVARTLSAQGVNAAGVGVDGGAVTVLGEMTGAELGACDPVATGCNGGDLTIDSAAGDPDWTELAVYGEAALLDLTTTELTAVGTATFTGAAAINAADVSATHVWTGSCTGCGP